MPPRSCRVALVAALVMLTASGRAWAQSQIVSEQVIRPAPEDDHARGGDDVDLNFGASVAISGRTAAIGIPHEVEEQQSGRGPGRVGIYSKTEEGWARSATLLPSNATDVRFGRELDLCGNLLIVEAERSTYVFRGHGTHWREIQRIAVRSPDKAIGPLVCGNDSFVQGVTRLDEQGEPRSTVDVYEQRRGHVFERVAKLRASDPGTSLGGGLAMERGIVVTGSSDGIHVFVRHGHRWIERQKIESAGPDGARIGGSVAIRDRIIIAGAPQVEVSAEPPAPVPDGDAFVFLPYRHGWFESQSLNNPPALPELGSSGLFGSQIAMGRQLAAVVAPLSDSDQIFNKGVVVVFDRIGEHFTLARAVHEASEDRRIPDIDMSGRRLILGDQEPRSPFARPVVGRVVIIEFEASPAPVTDTDHEDADQSDADEP